MESNLCLENHTQPNSPVSGDKAKAQPKHKHRELMDAEGVGRRFWKKLKIADNGCWEWDGHTNGDGYGEISIRQSHLKYLVVGCHRVAWMLVYGTIPDGQCVLHKCDNPTCCNPLHLFLGTQLENIADRTRKGRTQRRGRPKLTKEQVIEIRRLASIGTLTKVEISKLFNVQNAAISKVVLRQRWANI